LKNRTRNANLANGMNFSNTKTAKKFIGHILEVAEEIKLLNLTKRDVGPIGLTFSIPKAIRNDRSILLIITELAKSFIKYNFDSPKEVALSTKITLYPLGLPPKE
jgi:hypothetical protein